jgi:hypothetical protein
MSRWGSAKARKVLAALLRIGWRSSENLADRTEFSPVLTGQISCLHFSDAEEIGPRMLARIGKKTGLTPDDL